jgi:DNA-binding transcriptional MerR regulator
MDESLSQITFEFFGAKQEEPKEFLSGQPLPVPKAPSKTRGRRSLKDIEADADQVNIPEDEILFQKQYYSIGEVAVMFHVNTSLIRYWENEFDILEPRKNRKGDRFFKPTDVKNLQLIHDLLRRRKFTIEGAKEYIKKNRQAREKFEMIESLQKLRSFLLELKANL